MGAVAQRESARPIRARTTDRSVTPEAITCDRPRHVLDPPTKDIRGATAYRPAARRMLRQSRVAAFVTAHKETQVNNRIVCAALLCVAAMPAGAQGMVSNYWDHYAVKMSRELVPEDSDASPAYRSQYAVMTLDEANRVAAARHAREAKERVTQDEPATLPKRGAACTCERDG